MNPVDASLDPEKNLKSHPTIFSKFFLQNYQIISRKNTENDINYLVYYLICEKPELTFLTVERGSIINHFRVNFNFMYKLHMITKLFKVPNVACKKILKHNYIFEKENNKKFLNFF